MDGGGVFGLILLFGVFFAAAGYYCGRPERFRQHAAALKAKIPGQRAQTRPDAGLRATPAPNFAMGAGLAANDSATPYVAPRV